MKHCILLCIALCCTLIVFSQTPSANEAQFDKMERDIITSPHNISHYHLDKLIPTVSNDELFRISVLLGEAEVLEAVTPKDLRKYYFPYLLQLFSEIINRTPVLQKMAMNRTSNLEFLKAMDFTQISDEQLMMSYNSCCSDLASFLNIITYSDVDSMPVSQRSLLHYAEAELYGDNLYMRTVVKDTLPSWVMETMAKVVGSTSYIDIYTYQQRGLQGEHLEELAQNAKAFTMYDIYYMPSTASTLSCINLALRATGGDLISWTQECHSIINQRNQTSNDSTLILLNQLQMQRETKALRFEQLRAQYQAANIPFAFYYPNQCPESYRDSPEFEEYEQEYVYFLAQKILFIANYSIHLKSAMLSLAVATYQFQDILYLYNYLLERVTTYNEPWSYNAIKQLVLLFRDYVHFSNYMIESAAGYYLMLQGETELVEQILNEDVLSYYYDYKQNKQAYKEELYIFIPCMLQATSALLNINESKYHDLAVEVVDNLEKHVNSLKDNQVYTFGFLYDCKRLLQDYAYIISSGEKLWSKLKTEEEKAWIAQPLLEASLGLKDSKRALKYGRYWATDSIAFSQNGDLFLGLIDAAARENDTAAISHYTHLFSKTITHDVQKMLYKPRSLRSSYWTKYQANITPWINSIATHSCKQPNNTLNDLLYNWALLSKGVLLESDQQLNDIFSSHTNPLIERLFSALQIFQHNLQTEQKNDSLYNQTLSYIELCTEALERELEQASTDTALFQLYSYRQVREKLPNDAVAVEFMLTPNGYIASLLRKSWEHPKIIVLNANKEINQMALRQNNIAANGQSKAPTQLVTDINYAYKLKDIYRKVWAPIIQAAELQEGEHLYFSPDGALNQLAVEYATCEDGLPFNEHYAVHRLTSTRSFCKQYPQTSMSVALYGGLYYNAQPTLAHSSAHTISDTIVTAILQTKGVTDSIKYLASSLEEVLSIADLMRQRSVMPILYTGSDGTEETFKALSGISPAVIHLSTHGYYMPALEQEQRSKSGTGVMIRQNNLNVGVDYSMNRTMLFMANAEAAWQGKRPSQGEDGILTAYEISQMDLNGTDLVVTSACQTGLGDITSDGVAGLGRGFKNAGVHSILLTLWEVEAESSRIFMTTFYQVLMETNDKDEALRRAQQTLQVMPQYKNPYFWAPYILLDAK